MDYKNIIFLPDEMLRETSKKINPINDVVKKLAKSMKEATLSWEDSRKHEVGVALAAVQVGILNKMIIVRNNFEDKSDRTFQVFINPKITKLYGEVVEDFEGCLSIKNLYGRVPRYSRVKLSAQDLNGKEVRINAEGFLARIFQHEVDHTKGVLFIDHIKNTSDAFYALKEDGSMEQIDYDKEIKSNRILW